MQYIPNVTAVKEGKEKPNYIVPEMEKILGVTYGSAIYQEQIQQIFHNIAGFTMGEADIIRRAMSKKHLNELTAAKPAFVEGLKKKNAKDGDIETFWNQLLDFASYAFNHSHAAAYSVVSYYTAWLKHYYPAAFLAATMSYSTFEKIPVYAMNCKRYGINILTPDINTGIPAFAPIVGGQSIRYGLSTIKGVAGAAQTILNARKAYGPYKDFQDFILRCSVWGVSSTAITNLIVVGALDSFIGKEQRATCAENVKEKLQECRRAIQSFNKSFEAENGRDATEDEIFRALTENGSHQWKMTGFSIIPEPFAQEQLLKFERDLLGIYVSGSPIEPHLNVIRKERKSTIAGASESKGVILCGLVSDIQIIHRKRDGAPMAKFVLEDETGNIPAIMFTKLYAAFRDELRDGCVAKITGKVDIDNSMKKDDNSEKKKQLIVVDFFRVN